MEPLEGHAAKDEQPLLLELPEKPESTEGSKTETEAKGPVRLRQPQRQQFAMMVQCFDDLVREDHPVRMVAAVVEQLDVQEFHAPIQAREGVAGRDATDPRLLIGLWLYACIRGIGSAREVARRCEESIPFRWLCGGVTVNHRMLSDFRTDHGKALDNLFTQVVASLVDQGLVKVSRISQDGVRVRVGAGAGSFRREERLQKLLEEAQQHVEELKKQLEAPEQMAAGKAKKVKAEKRRTEEKQKRLEAALGQLPELKEKQEKAAQRAGKGKCGDKIRNKELRVSTTDAEARVMKMANGGFNPAVNVQLAADTESRAIVGVEVSNEGYDAAGLSAAMRAQVEERTGKKVEEQLLDGGYLRVQDIEDAHEQQVKLYVPAKGAKNPENRGQELEIKRGDKEGVREWKQRMASEEGQQIYKQRAATSETINADLRTYRGLTQMLVRGLTKNRCIALWCALAHNVMHFGRQLLQSKLLPSEAT
jgi:transposase